MWLKSAKISDILRVFIKQQRCFVRRHKIVQRLFIGASTKNVLLQIYRPILAISLFGAHSPEVPTPNMSEKKETLDNADQLMDENRYQECYELLTKFPGEHDPDILWRTGRVMHKLSKSATDKKSKEEYIRKGFKCLEEALKLDDKNFAIHKWYAILLDSNSELDGLKARASQLVNVKKHMIRATELNPKDPTSWYLLGEFEYGIADMSWYVSKIVSALFAAPPTGSYEKAQEYFLRAESLEPNFYSNNHLMLAKTYMHFKDNEKAREYLNKAINHKVNNYDDKICKENAEQLLKKL